MTLNLESISVAEKKTASLLLLHRTLPSCIGFRMQHDGVAEVLHKVVSATRDVDGKIRAQPGHYQVGGQMLFVPCRSSGNLQWWVSVTLSEATLLDDTL